MKLDKWNLYKPYIKLTKISYIETVERTAATFNPKYEKSLNFCFKMNAFWVLENYISMVIHISTFIFGITIQYNLHWNFSYLNA